MTPSDRRQMTRRQPRGHVREDRLDLVPDAIQGFVQDDVRPDIGLQTNGEGDLEVHYHVRLAWSGPDGVDPYQFCASAQVAGEVIRVQHGGSSSVWSEITLHRNDPVYDMQNGDHLDLTVFVNVVERMQNGEMLRLPVKRLMPLNDCPELIRHTGQALPGVTLVGPWVVRERKLDPDALRLSLGRASAVLDEMPRKMIQGTPESEENIPESKAPVGGHVRELVNARDEVAGHGVSNVRRVSVRLEALRRAPWWTAVKLIDPVAGISFQGIEVFTCPVELVPPTSGTGC